MEPSFPHGGDPSKHQHHPPKSSSELLSSAKLVAGAAQSTFAHKSDAVDKARVADAAADLLGAASHYGKLEEKSFGKYVDKAETYLHQYHSSHSSHSSTPAAAGEHGHSAPAASHKPSESSGSEGGYGDYLKMAQGFLKKH
ncbi:nodulin-related protein 1-like [Punica granatum]|uniref:Uncharacterized protein n=2 Tax=Punica granatum TaxID=22663 RepID=A0A218XXY2_PUNGR|nr:nodulin-related protein 1-like [Punica granatum]XP_031386391.1 nodulin-related protein 1-like [Punica granatum]OWM89494.1 hypothetical protein CDL15_Pgr024242 [Punica granatum]OWM89496.1 hypothetical protein CDL15_Pgr024244 [Punica granatum]PKH89590.1 hypothetical protein CRG98_049965 [Punica granatum]